MDIRRATLSDLDAITALLMRDAADRQAVNPTLWALAEDGASKLSASIQSALEGKGPPFRQKWLVAIEAGRAVGVTHSILLPVPPIYAGEFGPPGLVMEDSFASPDAPPGTAAALIAAAERDLRDAGAQILLASCVPDGALQPAYRAKSYAPLTLYLAKTGLSCAGPSAPVRGATEHDLAGISASSAANRALLHRLDPFWKPHPDADTRFATWMAKSLTLSDRDMFVADTGGVSGYAISQPATPLHFAAPHDISRIGIIDDYFSDDLAADAYGPVATALLATAEGALAKRGAAAAMVVCPAAWSSKIACLRDAGYVNALTWHIKRTG